MGIQRLVKIGYWMDVRGGAQKVIDVLFERLPDPRDLVDPNWSAQERELICAYLDAAPAVEHWMGYSWCRFGCPDSIDMGTTDKSDGAYIWPEGLSHYVRVHSVRLPEEFLRHIHNRVLSR